MRILRSLAAAGLLSSASLTAAILNVNDVVRVNDFGAVTELIDVSGYQNPEADQEVNIVQPAAVLVEPDSVVINPGVPRSQADEPASLGPLAFGLALLAIPVQLRRTRRKT